MVKMRVKATERERRINIEAAAKAIRIENKHNAEMVSVPNKIEKIPNEEKEEENIESTITTMFII